MTLTMVDTPTFLRLASAIWVDDELMEFKVWLAGNALFGDVIAGTLGLRKVRWSRQGMGKRGGARVAYYNPLEDGRMVLLMACATSNFDSLPADFLLVHKKAFENA